MGGNQAPWNTAVAVAMAGMDGAAEIRGQRSEDGCDFVSEDIGGEMVTRRDCPGKATPCTLSAHNGEDTVVGPRGILDLDPSSVVPHAGRRVDLNHDLARSGPARTGKGNPSQLGSSFIPQDADGETVMPPYCPEYGAGAGGGGCGSACRGYCMGGSGGREFCRLGSRRAARLHPICRLGPACAGRHTWRNVVHPGRKPPREMPESGCGFVSEEVGGEMVLQRDCPEIIAGAGGGGRGVKAVEGNRSPSPYRFSRVIHRRRGERSDPLAAAAGE